MALAVWKAQVGSRAGVLSPEFCAASDCSAHAQLQIWQLLNSEPSP